MVQLYVVRHAEAASGAPDEERPLTSRGRDQARALGDRLARGRRPDAVVTSPLLRARETGELIAAAVGASSESDERLAPGATPDDVRAAVAGRGEVVVVVAHQPDCGRIAAAFRGGDEPSFPPGGVHAVELSP